MLQVFSPLAVTHAIAVLHSAHAWCHGLPSPAINSCEYRLYYTGNVKLLRM